MLIWLDLSIVGLVMCMLWLNEYVLLIGMVFLNRHKAFQSNLHILMNFPFLAWFHDMCAYDLILSRSGVLTIFSPIFPNILGSGRWRDFETTFKEDIHPSWVGPYFPRAMPLSSLWCCSSFTTSMFFPFHLSTKDCLSYMWLLLHWCMG